MAAPAVKYKTKVDFVMRNAALLSACLVRDFKFLDRASFDAAVDRMKSRGRSFAVADVAVWPDGHVITRIVSGYNDSPILDLFGCFDDSSDAIVH